MLKVKVIGDPVEAGKVLGRAVMNQGAELLVSPLLKEAILGVPEVLQIIAPGPHAQANKLLRPREGYATK